MLQGLLGPADFKYLMEQAHCGPGNERPQEDIVLREGDTPPLPTTTEELMALKTHGEGLLMAGLDAFPIKVSWEKLWAVYVEGREFTVDVCAQFVEAFSNIMGMDSGADQVHTPVLATFLSALLPILQTQIKEKVSGWQAQASVQILAAATRFGGNPEDKEKERLKTAVLASLKGIIPTLANP